MQGKKSVNGPEKWYNNHIKYPFGKELLIMEKKKATSRSRRSRITAI